MFCAFENGVRCVQSVGYNCVGTVIQYVFQSNIFLQDTSKADPTCICFLGTENIPQVIKGWIKSEGARRVLSPTKQTKFFYELIIFVNDIFIQRVVFLN